MRSGESSRARREPFLRGPGRANHEAAGLQQVGDQLEVQQVVLDDEDFASS